jgi:cation transport ATPase
VAGQLRTAQFVAERGAAQLVHDLILTSFRSFWGQFGWMGVPLDPRTVRILLVATAAAVLAGTVAFWRSARALTTDQRWALAILAMLGVSTAGVFVYYNLGFQQFQGRYLYSALLLLGLVAAAGVREWARWALALARRLSKLPRWVEPALTLSAVAVLALFAAWALYRVVVPNLS